MAGDTCGRGHPWAEYGRAYPGRRGRVCLACRRDASRRARARRRAAEPPPPRRVGWHREDTLDQAGRVARLTRAGQSARQIAWDLGCSARQVVRLRGVARSAGWLPRWPG